MCLIVVLVTWYSTRLHKTLTVKHWITLFVPTCALRPVQKSVTSWASDGSDGHCMTHCTKTKSVSVYPCPCLTPWALVLKCSATFTHSGQDHFCFHEFLFCTLSHPLGPTVNRNFQFANLAASLVLASAASASDKWWMLLYVMRHVDRCLDRAELASRQQSFCHKQVVDLLPPKVNIRYSLFAAIGNQWRRYMSQQMPYIEKRSRQ